MNHNPQQALSFAKAAYLSDSLAINALIAPFGHRVVEMIDERSTDTQCFVSQAVTGDVAVSFRGTQVNSWKDFNTDLNCDVSEYHGLAHEGFLSAMRSVSGRIFRTLDKISMPGRELSFFGHSLGGALARLFAMQYAHFPRRVGIDRVETFGSPRVGDRQFQGNYNSALRDETFNHVNCADFAAHFPAFWRWPRIGYRHVGKTIYYDSTGRSYLDPVRLFRVVDQGLAIWKHIGKPGIRSAIDHQLASYERLLSLEVNRKGCH